MSYTSSQAGSDYERSRQISMRKLATAIIDRLTLEAQVSIEVLAREDEALTFEQLSRRADDQLVSRQTLKIEAVYQLISEGLIQVLPRSVAGADTRKDLRWLPSPLGEVAAELISERDQRS